MEAGESVAVGATVTVVLADGESEPRASGPAAAAGAAQSAAATGTTVPVSAAASPPAAGGCALDHRVWDGLDAAELLSEFADQISAYGRYDDDR